MREDGPPAPDPISEGIRLFNERHFFEAHEVLEDAWHRERGEARRFLQGLIQVCAGCHHYQNGNARSALAVLARGMDKIRGYPDAYWGLDVKQLLAQLEDTRRRMESQSSDPSTPFQFPVISLRAEE